MITRLARFKREARVAHVDLTQCRSVASAHLTSAWLNGRTNAWDASATKPDVPSFVANVIAISFAMRYLRVFGLVAEVERTETCLLTRFRLRADAREPRESDNIDAVLRSVLRSAINACERMICGEAHLQETFAALGLQTRDSRGWLSPVCLVSCVDYFDDDCSG